MIWLAVGVCLALAGAAVAVYQYHAARRWARAHLSVSARLHEVRQQRDSERRRCNLLLMRLGRQQERGDDLQQAALEVQMLAQLDALYSGGELFAHQGAEQAVSAEPAPGAHL